MSCCSYIRELRCIRPYIDSKIANTIAASIVHCKLHYLYANFNDMAIGGEKI